MTRPCLPNGDVLLFDDGQYLRAKPPALKVFEIDPRTDEIVWSYSGYGLVGTELYSAIAGGAPWLPNGNTLVTLGVKGQLMEITPDGIVVWNHRVASGADLKYPAVSLHPLFKVRCYPASEVEPLLRAGPT